MDKEMTLNTFVSEFTEKLRAQLEERYGEKVDVNLHTVLKTNVEKEAISVVFENSPQICPTLYPEDYYSEFQRGRLLDNIASQVAENVYAAHIKGPVLPDFTPEEAKKHIRLAVVNTEYNQKLLSDTPSFPVCGGELSAYPKWYLNPEASFRITEEIASKIGLTADEVLQIGLSNVRSEPFEAIPLGKMIENMTGIDFTDDMDPDTGIQMIVLTNENRMQGANTILNEDALHQVYDMCNGDMCLLPSSIHEWICIPITDGLKPDMLRSMVSEINESTVAPEEKLGDFILKYDGVKLTPVLGNTFDIEGIKEDTPKMEQISFKMSF